LRNVNKYCVNLALIILKITLKKILLFLILLSFSCNTGNLTVIADLPSSLKEVSAAETTTFSDLLWVIEDAGNKNRLYGLNEKGEIKREIKISNTKNKDWEDLTSDIEGNIYIGDFGDNHKKRKKYRILKVKYPKKKTTKITPKHINFILPIDIKSLDFEAFFY
jgi:sugar lactone lactonase YvrE